MSVKKLYTAKEYKTANPLDQAFYREYDMKADHADGFYNGMEDKQSGRPITPNESVYPMGYIWGYNAGYYFANKS